MLNRTKLVSWTTRLALALAGVTLLACAMTLARGERLTRVQGRVVTPMGYRYEFCFVKPGTPKVFLLADSGVQELSMVSHDWAMLTARLGNEGWEMVGPGPMETGKPDLVLWFKRGRLESP